MRYILLFFIFLGVVSCERTIQTSKFMPTTLYLRYSCKLNNDESFHRVLVKINHDKTEHEQRDAYSFNFKNQHKEHIENDFYVLDVNKCAYTDTTNWFYQKTITIKQLRKSFFYTMHYMPELYFRSFTHIYIIDLDLPHPKNPNLFKVIEVRPYNYFDHVEVLICGTGRLEAENTERPEWGKWLGWLYQISER